MGLPLDQEKLIAGLEELEKRLRQSKASSDAAVERASPSSIAPPTYDHAELHAGEDWSFPADEQAALYPDYELEERANSRCLLLAISGLVLVIFVGALGVTLAYWTTPSSEPLTADVRPSVKDPTPVAVAPAPAEAVRREDVGSPPAVAAPQAAAAPPASSPPAPAAQPMPSANVAPPTGTANVPAQQAPPVEPAAPPPEIRTVTILPDGSLAPAAAGQNPALPPPAPAGTPPSSAAGQTDSPASSAVKPDTTGQNAQAAKAAKKRAAARAAKKSAAKAESAAAPADPTPHAAPPPANDGILQGAQRALGSVTGAVRKLVGGE
jgi:hypothetical protein